MHKLLHLKKTLLGKKKANSRQSSQERVRTQSMDPLGGSASGTAQDGSTFPPILPSMPPRSSSHSERTLLKVTLQKQNRSPAVSQSTLERKRGRTGGSSASSSVAENLNVLHRSRTGTREAEYFEKLNLAETSASPSRRSSGSSTGSPEPKRVGREIQLELAADELRVAPGPVSSGDALAQGPSSSRASYGLIHTLGRTQLDEVGGDGAYSVWMQRYFESERSRVSRCVAVSQIAYSGAVGNIKDKELPRKFNPVFLKAFSETLDSVDFRQAPTIILNWHVRFTNGTPNGWTGRGMNRQLERSLLKTCKHAGKKLGIVYTVHETSKLKDKLVEPAGLISLNPDVGDAMSVQFDGIRRYTSRVPGLLNSPHTEKFDWLVDSVSLYLDPAEKTSADGNLVWAHAQQWFRSRYARPDKLEDIKGIVIFGMIMKRHGLSRDVIEQLARSMDEAGLNRELKIVIAGKLSDEQLVAELQELAAESDRVHFAGLIEGLDQFADCRYAISFDTLGYRHNASAMINTVREGHLLFSKRDHSTDNAATRAKPGGGRQKETDKELIDRTIKVIKLAEANEHFYFKMLAQSQPRVRSNAPRTVGAGLDNFFESIAGGLE